MKVSIKAAAALGHYVGDLDKQLVVGKECDIEGDSTVAGLLQSMGFPEEVRLQIFINGRLAETGCRLREGDQIFLGLLMAGG